ncbi:hypothetical protein IV203_037879 [Nitzschia inconspicua]|uniref:Uncharacterized protein n=1 Tax=Nitzschia inconspicua TaxID=303405 RepID=A0A9K3PYJ5_9STRA|nr:hypothetical protein IV203_037879 [Nitzschia inconspicua]
MDDETIIEKDQRNMSGDGLLFDSAVLESLNRLTDEIQEGLLTDGDSDAASESYDSNEYTDDDEDPDSGENKLFNMMDDLVMELQMELQDDEPSPVIEAVKDDKGAEVNDTSTPEDESEVTALQSTQEIENAVDGSTGEDSIPSSSPSRLHTTNSIPPSDRTNVPLLDHERVEKQRRLHTQVKLLLHQVSMMAEQAEAEESHRDDVEDQTTASTGRPRGDSGADKLQRLLGAISSYSTPPTTAPQTVSNTIPDEQAKTARAMSSYTQRKRREYLLRKQAATNDANVDGRQSADVMVLPSSHKEKVTLTSPTQKKRRPRTNKHKKGKQKQLTPSNMSDLQYQQHMRRIQKQQHPHVQQQQAHSARQNQEPIPQQSLRALLSQLLVLDERLSRGEVLV